MATVAESSSPSPPKSQELPQEDTTYDGASLISLATPRAVPWNERHNSSHAALGNLRRVTICGTTWFLSPDLCAWIFPNGITAFLTMSTVYLVWEQRSALELLLLAALLSCAAVCSLLVGTTDPGVYPRLQQWEADPLLSQDDRPTVLCKNCQIRRPPRSAHCYACNVCVLEHDHHCGVLGGCVGQRSLRWFVGYLLSVSSAALMGSIWLVFSLLKASAEENAQIFSKRSNKGKQGMSTAGHIFLLIFIGNIVLMVGGMGLYYLYLMLSDTTRREAQGKQQSKREEGGSHLLWLPHRLRRVLFPPPSMIEDRGKGPIDPFVI